MVCCLPYYLLLLTFFLSLVGFDFILNWLLITSHVHAFNLLCHVLYCIALYAACLNNICPYSPHCCLFIVYIFPFFFLLFTWIWFECQFWHQVVPTTPWSQLRGIESWFSLPRSATVYIFLFITLYLIINCIFGSYILFEVLSLFFMFKKF
jgi:hypothetical protein